MITYSVDIRCNQTGEVRRTPMRTGWSDTKNGSLQMYRERMCDCNLYGYRENGFRNAETGDWVWTEVAHENVAYDFVKAGCCDHSMPTKRYTALRAYLSDGRVIDLQTGEIAKAA